MATMNYNLPTIAGNMTADVVRDMNALAEATDEAIKEAVDGVDLTTVTQQISKVDQRVTTHLADNKAHGIGDRAALLTAEKATLVGALNELFTNVSNGKDLIGTAITDVDSSKVVPNNPTFKQLADLTRSITTGFKQATGYNATNNGLITVSGLSFRPKLIVAYWDGTTPTTRVAVYAVQNIAPTNYVLNFSYVGTTPTIGAFVINPTGFNVTFAHQIHNIPIAWVAFG